MSTTIETQKKNITILGSTGSIGRQTLEVIKNNASMFRVEALSANKNADLLIEQAHYFKPNIVVIADTSLYDKVYSALDPVSIKVYTGVQSLVHIAELDIVDIVLTALVGAVGMLPTIAAIKAGKRIALANKETLVMAGDIIMKLIKEYNAHIIPVDSEHSAIYQCLLGEYNNAIDKIYLTASGGPFRGKTKKQLQHITKEQALKHPNWIMGDKITIDSATLVNKGLEVIEAKWLFDLSPQQIKVVIHPQSVIHSMVAFCDGSIKAQLGYPDMYVPIQYALSYPYRINAIDKAFNISEYPTLDFHEPDTETFISLTLAYEVLSQGGNMPCIYNAANEIAVAHFLEDKIKFLHIFAVIEYCLAKVSYQKANSIDDLIQTDINTRLIAKEYISTL